MPIPEGDPIPALTAPCPDRCPLLSACCLADAPVYNRLGVALAHSTRYAFSPQVRLAADVGVSRSTISRLLGGKTRPSLRLAQAVARALTRDLGRPLPVEEL